MTIACRAPRRWGLAASGAVRSLAAGDFGAGRGPGLSRPLGGLHRAVQSRRRRGCLAADLQQICRADRRSAPGDREQARRRRHQGLGRAGTRGPGRLHARHRHAALQRDPGARPAQADRLHPRPVHLCLHLRGRARRAAGARGQRLQDAGRPGRLRQGQSGQDQGREYRHARRRLHDHLADRERHGHRSSPRSRSPAAPRRCRAPSPARPTRWSQAPCSRSPRRARSARWRSQHPSAIRTFRTCRPSRSSATTWSPSATACSAGLRGCRTRSSSYWADVCQQVTSNEDFRKEMNDDRPAAGLSWPG